jgi:hypothetical protein
MLLMLLKVFVFIVAHFGAKYSLRQVSVTHYTAVVLVSRPCVRATLAWIGIRQVLASGI